ncbi:bifunctional indole-3-glycerol-phosphate synthase TrpC/phosphoribosylanthranilate isomerase TrpF [Corynebacterium pseudotuberculosis]|uniref:bifunctional indole-3-glycerol-phosphate synthase TrpC/phosphoribosylanthranilate isomerase TrpF n=1 Tax=Corynebacterium pseudotuberculosis TaxID=1719 RepID=UPI0020C83AB4|nr:bifunctional indole-3-glycerol-phosphate synthase TrpC/phosphoribosylanthranilate isomerase TrpF [Corynebacterium pseudotuberculosis]UTO24465.1 bifunctional indole-3-glycerol-phosphate synthase TrpC/phosphoribosylanthranilate isomerase TrpF [Corynebacterium pseudotuberculosis]
MQNNVPMPTVLEEIVNTRRSHVQEISARISHINPLRLPRSTKSLFQALGGSINGGAASRRQAYSSASTRAPHFIMECKSASPSLGTIRTDYSPGDIARIYSRYASAISVLCEPDKFNGDYDHLATVAASTHLPVLCKDFIVDPVQVQAARYFGADAVLLMLSVLDDATYLSLSSEAERLGLDVLTEVINEEEVKRGIRLGAKIFGVNHRNLHDLSIDLSRSSQLEPLIPENAVLVSESGIKTNETVRQLAGHSDAFLVGSQLTSHSNIDSASRSLVYGTNKVCGLTTTSAAQNARAVGATHGGLIFENSSPRNVSRETAEKIIAAEPNLNYVAVSRRDHGWEEILLPEITSLQIHAPYQGSIAGERALIDNARRELQKAGREDVSIWRAVSMTLPEGAATATALADDVDMLLLDAGIGGTGTSFNWEKITPDIAPKAILAGGLNLDNLPEALKTGCAGLDLNSGFEYSSTAGPWSGMKDSGLLRQAFSKIRNFHY